MSPDGKNNIDRSQVFAVYNVNRLVIGSVLFSLSLADTGSRFLSDDTERQLVGADVFVIILIIALRGSDPKLTMGSELFGLLKVSIAGAIHEKQHLFQTAEDETLLRD
jgi:hypothetical protein